MTDDPWSTEEYGDDYETDDEQRTAFDGTEHLSADPVESDDDISEIADLEDGEDPW